MSKLERWFWMALSATFIILYLLKGCNKVVCPTVETISVHDTTPGKIPEPITITHNEKDKPIIHDTLPGEVLHDTSWIPADKIDTLKILSDYFAKVYYSDTQKVSLGKIIIQDTVSRNRITSRKVLTDLSFETLKPITITKRTQFFYGFSMFGNKQTVLQMAGVNFSMKTKKDYIFEVGGYAGNGKIVYSLGFKVKL